MSQWWRDGVVYQLYPRSFADSNGDGVGDLQGIIEHLDELSELGVNMLWLSPVYPSPDADNGYDIADYKDIDPKFGTLEDMDRLIKLAGQRGIKVIMDLVVNHTSDEHPWFVKSRDKNSPYRDYYIWRQGKNGGPPNNWTSFFAEDCWEYDPKSGEYYLHLFAKKQPDLNWRNPKVLEEIESVMSFWLDRGVAGFRCDVINILYKTSLEDGKKRLALTGSEHYISQEGTHEILRRLRKDVLSRYDCFTVGETVFVTPSMARDLCAGDRGELDMVFSFEHMETDQYFLKWFSRKFSPEKFAKCLSKWQNELEWNANYLENHDQPRSVSRFGDDGEYWEKSAKLLCTLLLSLRGTPFLYQGQEIGMTNFDFSSMDQVQDVESHNVYKMAKRLGFPAKTRWKMIKRKSRDNARTPVQWTSGPNGGFTAGKPWLGINANYTRINFASQLNDPGSVRSYYKRMIKLRANSDVLRQGDYQLLEAKGTLYVFCRKLGGKKLTIALNMGTKPVRTGYSGVPLLSNYGTERFDGLLRPYEAVILDDKG